MKRITWVFMAVGLAVVAVRPAAALEKSGLRWDVGLDYLMKGNAYKSTEDLYTFSAGGGELKKKLKDGMGVHVGIMSPTSKSGFSWGGSLGYILGPTAEFKPEGFIDGGEQVAFAPFTYESAKDLLETSYIRIMLEGQKDIPTSEHFAFRLRGGIGLAQGTLNEEVSSGYEAFGYFDPFLGDYNILDETAFSSSESKKWTGFTLEIGPSVLFTGKHANVELGLTYSMLPTMSKDDQKGLAEFKWNPLGIRLGVEF